MHPRSEQRSGQLKSNHVTYATDIFSYLSKISSEIQIFNFGYPSSGHCIYVRKDVRDLWLFFEAERGPRAKLVGNTAPVYSDGAFHINRLLGSLHEIKNT